MTGSRVMHGCIDVRGGVAVVVAVVVAAAELPAEAAATGSA